MIDDGERPKRPAAEQLIMDQIHAPTPIRNPRLGNRATMRAHVFTTAQTHADLRSLESIPAVHAFPIHLPALSSKHDIDALIAEALSGMGDLAYVNSQRRLISGLAVGMPPAMGKLP